jgi:hypothetical protein
VSWTCVRAFEANRYSTASVTPGGILIPPTVSVSGTAGPGGVPGGISKLICWSPGVLPGTVPAYITVAGRLPIVAVTGSASRVYPSAPCGANRPKPVPKMLMMVPAGDGGPIRLSWLTTSA